ncbi:DNA-directed RNA polymerase II subunit RPB11-a [Grifola frondosa]|uniref:DNA-directed RNA polymerase II subunit RPB11-a n=1 Tax=Grifola frondosa TaxID=5627 RepID=A0A1C7LT80_GRIFR|nr:DNA-directed RNA polymerase II subunit RPB11-a [Grifola frondosa]
MQWESSGRQEFEHTYLEEDARKFFDRDVRGTLFNDDHDRDIDITLDFTVLLFVRLEGERPVEVIEDTKIPNAATIKIVKQDHTLGNLLRSYVEFKYSRITHRVLTGGPADNPVHAPDPLRRLQSPHPLQPYFLIKIQTDGTITPAAILEEACTKLIGTIATLETKFKREFTFKDVDGGVQEDAYGTAMAAGTNWPDGRDYLDF